MKAASALFLIVLLVCPPAGRAEPPQPLPALGIDINATSVSGLSSGAYMAGQFEVAHAKIIIGAALIAGGPYACADTGKGWWTNTVQALYGCAHTYLRAWGVPDAHASAERVRDLAREGRIDPLDDLLPDKVYLFWGTNDHVVEKAIVEAAAAFYRDLGLPADHIRLDTTYPAGHGFLTWTYGNGCDESDAPFIRHCKYDQASFVLNAFYGPLEKPAFPPTGRTIIFDQRPFARDGGGKSLSDEGAVYVPDACAKSGSRCRVHIAFHGCNQSRSAVGNAFVEGAGFDRWADTNRLVILYPQVDKGFGNPRGCWDWWGYTGRDFLTRDAPQIKAVYRMLERLAASPN